MTSDRRRDAVDFLAACTPTELDALLAEARGGTTKQPEPDNSYPEAWKTTPRRQDSNR